MKIGLALSGGGFRAAFFHVGVLARLAELGILNRVEVISTVSGGSIVGALYYIRLRRLLESTPDGEIGRTATSSSWPTWSGACARGCRGTSGPASSPTR